MMNKKVRSFFAGEVHKYHSGFFILSRIVSQGLIYGERYRNQNFKNEYFRRKLQRGKNL